MAIQSVLTRGTQVGVETTEGTATPANKRFLQTGITISPRGEFDSGRALGSKVTTWAENTSLDAAGKMEGKPTYDELGWWLAMVYGRPVSAADDLSGGSSTLKKHTFAINSSGVDNPITLTIENGDTTRAGRAVGCIADSWEFKADGKGVETSGSLIGRSYEDGITLTASPVDQSARMMSRKDVCLFIGADLGALTKLEYGFGWDFKISDRFSLVRPLDCALQGAAKGRIEAELKSELKLTLAVDDQGMLPLAAAKAGGTLYVRLEATRDTGTGTEKLRFRHTIAGKVTDMGEMGDDEENVHVIEWGFTPAHDTTLGASQEVVLVNSLAGYTS